jgi:hypothetical protein
MAISLHRQSAPSIRLFNGKVVAGRLRYYDTVAESLDGSGVLGLTAAVSVAYCAAFPRMR